MTPLARSAHGPRAAARASQPKGRRGERAGERGAAIYLFAAGLFAFLGLAALAVDLGMLYTARTQAQRAADAGALAGAGYLLRTPGDLAGARAEAELFAERHEVIGDSIEIDPAADVEFEADTLVRVFVRRTEVGANPVATYFARTFGIFDVDVIVKAAAIVGGGTKVEQCLFPFIPPDAWREADGTRSIDSLFADYTQQPVFGPGDSYRAPDRPGDVWADFTGWGAKAGSAPTGDQGRYLRAKLGGTGQTGFASPGWWYAMNWPPDQQGGGMKSLTDAIKGSCLTYPLGEGDRVYIQTGFGGNAIHKALEETLEPQNGPETAPEALDCYTHGVACGNGRRRRTMALYDPNVPPGPGSSTPTRVGNFAEVWLAGFCDDPGLASKPICSVLTDEKDREDTFVVMYLGPTSSYAASGDASASSGSRALRLVE